MHVKINLDRFDSIVNPLNKDDVNVTVTLSINHSGQPGVFSFLLLKEWGWGGGNPPWQNVKTMR